MNIASEPALTPARLHACTPAHLHTCIHTCTPATRTPAFTPAPAPAHLQVIPDIPTDAVDVYLQLKSNNHEIIEIIISCNERPLSWLV